MAAAVTTDEIFDRYLKKAITETNRLSDEIAQAAAGRVPVLPSGCPVGWATGAPAAASATSCSRPRISLIALSRYRL